MKRREFIALVGARLLRGRFVLIHSRQHLPLVGFLNSASANGYASMASAFRQGLKETGYVAGCGLPMRW
jgi:putative ABC transport system substrate-binding protein